MNDPIPSSLVVDQCWTVEGDITSGTPVWFSNQQILPAGYYKVSYVKGAYRPNAAQGWDVGTNWTLVTNNGGIIDVMKMPSTPTPFGAGSVPNGLFVTLGYDTQEACENQTRTASHVTFFHSGGPLGVTFYDDPYNDNVHGNPDPTWQLCKLKAATVVQPGCVSLTLYNTGFGAMGTIAPHDADPNWQLIKSADPSTPGPSVYVTGQVGLGDASPLSTWIGPKTGNYTSASGVYTYRYNIDLTGYDPATVKLTGRWAADDIGNDIIVNGVSTKQTSTTIFTFADFSISSGFIQGMNTIDFVTRNVPNNPSYTGFRVEWTSGVACKSVTTPPPGSDPGTSTPPAGTHHDTGSSSPPTPTGCTKETPTTGFLPAGYKALLDSLPNHPGGFGFIFKPGVYLTQQDGVESVLTGDIRFISESLDITCINAQANGIANTQFKFSIGQNFLNAFCLEIPGLKGKKGSVGDKGIAGRDGTGDGPRGDTGQSGLNATVVDTFTGIQLIELDEVHDTAVVSLTLNPKAGILEAVKAPIAVPANDAPAEMVSASPIYRDITFASPDLGSWQLFAPPGDPVASNTHTPDIDIIKLPDGWNGAAVGVVTMKLSKLVQLVVDYYNNLADNVINEWDREIKQYVNSKDQAARAIIADLAMELTECEWSAPLEFCVDISPLQCSAGGSGGAPIIAPGGGGTGGGLAGSGIYCNDFSACPTQLAIRFQSNADPFLNNQRIVLTFADGLWGVIVVNPANRGVRYTFSLSCGPVDHTGVTHGVGMVWTINMLTGPNPSSGIITTIAITSRTFEYVSPTAVFCPPLALYHDTNAVNPNSAALVANV